MSLISNRKRPRGFSESFENNKAAQSSTKSQATATTIPLSYENSCSGSSSSTSMYTESSPTRQMNININLSNDDSESTMNTSVNSPKLGKSRINFSSRNSQANYPTSNNPIDEDSNEFDFQNVDDDDDDDVIILEERQVSDPLRNNKYKAKRNNSDSAIFVDDDAIAAYNMFNVNNDLDANERKIGVVSNSVKKQRTNSLPQLPQARCFYNKIPYNYILQQPKLGNVKTNIIPHQLNLPPCDNKDGHYIIKPNDLFANRFVIVKLLGQGTFGKVVECYDKVNRENVAIKIIRNIPKYRDAAKIELRILSTLKQFDNDNHNHCIHLRECFDYRGHICIVTDLLKISLYDFLEKNKFISFPGSHIQAIAKQLIRSVTFLHDLNLIHTDLKPENILLHDDSYVKKNLHSSTIIASYLKLTNGTERKAPMVSKVLKDPLIQVIDFGSAIFNDEYHSSIVSTRHYRAPEIVLGVGWSFPCDMWSVGCILIELIIGEPLFKTHDNLEHLAMIEKICGYKIDKEMVRLSKKKENECGLNYFTDEYNKGREEDEGLSDDDVIIDDESTARNSLSLIFPSPSTTTRHINNVNQLSRIDIFISSRIGLDINCDYPLSVNYQKNRHLINFGNFTFWWFFIDLLRKLFVINPEHRLTTQEAMEHPWFNLGIEDEGTL